MTRESFLNRHSTSNGPSHKRAKKQEREVAKKLGGCRTPGSGNGDIKGDVRVKGFVRIECKTTGKRSFAVTMDMIEKIEAAALSAGEIPVLVVEFNDGMGHRLREVAVVPTYAIEHLRGTDE
jgi:Holliday junction resolvase